MNEIREYTEKIFEDIKHIDEFGNEYWLARELQKVLGYFQWRRFENTISKAKTSCDNSNVRVENHFANIGKMVFNTCSNILACLFCAGDSIIKPTPLVVLQHMLQFAGKPVLLAVLVDMLDVIKGLLGVLC